MGWVPRGACQALTQPIGARYLGLGTYSTRFVDVYATRNNPAALAQLTQTAVALYAERRFLQDDLNLYTGSLGMPVGNGAFALHGSYFGFNLQNQTQLQLAYGRKLGTKVDVGAAFDYRGLNQASIYGNTRVLTGSVGLMLHLSPKISAGLYAYNPIRAAWSKSEQQERLPSRYTLGMGYDASEKFFMSAELEHEEGANLNVNAGFQYRLLPQFFVRAGIATLTTNYFVGIGMELSGFRLDVATSYHPQLGLSPGLLLLTNFGKKTTPTP
ncbi:MAG: hypothetical protein EAY75_01535 [Bacteroidetes bacterium]|nr:MAG: hypothetical protein EAY75_01535 [Bacteroidota bacterium]